ncbi:hypothetical protein VTN00DRAFT_9008 [Thermoascus crustaceus]|uniref:uncharacterized protein n=1 Tax=Thermoascus crustaceus TaxID=5088 RepID=UPI003743DCA0
MESLTDTQWDITISGTGLAQSLLALALSRSGKKVLHVDKNPYYGGAEAAFSLQEAEEWVERLKQEPGREPFEDVSIYAPPEQGASKLSSSRAYTLSLSPHIIYCRSQLIPTLVSSKVYRQLEFQAVGSWWIFRSPGAEETGLRRVPSSREDVFADDNISMKSKRTLMKLLRHISQPPQEDESAAEPEDLDLPFADYLTSRFQIPSELYDPLLSLALSQSSPRKTSASYAVPRIKRHLASIGVFGPGFGSLLAKWGGSSEMSQVGCRALAVGGGVYVLDRGIQSVTSSKDELELQLSNGEPIRTKFVVGSPWDLPAETLKQQPACRRVARSISVVSSSLESLFPPTSEGGPIPAAAAVVFPGNTLSAADDTPPVYLLVHSSDTGECPVGQSVIYASVSLPGDEGQSLIDSAVQKLLQKFSADGSPTVLWSLRYTQLGLTSEDGDALRTVTDSPVSDNILSFPPPSLELAFDDGLIDAVKTAWKTVLGDEAHDEDFMKFEDREGVEFED